MEIKNIFGVTLHEYEGTTLEVLEHAVTQGVNMRGAILSHTILTGANLKGAELSRGVLNYANLTGADLRDAILKRADLRGARLGGADLSGVDLSHAIGNGKEVKSFQGLRYPLVFTADMLWVGCEGHSFTEWWAFTDDEIAEMDTNALYFWDTHKALIKMLVTSV